jgi:hypothetical protein
MRAHVAAMALALTIVGCGDGNGPKDFDNEEFVGAWRFTND